MVGDREAGGQIRFLRILETLLCQEWDSIPVHLPGYPITQLQGVPFTWYSMQSPPYGAVPPGGPDANLSPKKHPQRELMLH